MIIVGDFKTYFSVLVKRPKKNQKPSSYELFLNFNQRTSSILFQYC